MEGEGTARSARVYSAARGVKPVAGRFDLDRKTIVPARAGPRRRIPDRVVELVLDAPDTAVVHRLRSNVMRHSDQSSPPKFIEYGRRCRKVTVRCPWRRSVSLR